MHNEQQPCKLQQNLTPPRIEFEISFEFATCGAAPVNHLNPIYTPRNCCSIAVAAAATFAPPTTTSATFSPTLSLLDQ